HVHRAGDAAAAAVLGVGAHVELAAVAEVPVAVAVPGVARERAGAVHAGGDGVLAHPHAHLSAPATVVEVAGDVGLAAVGDVAVAVLVAVVARGDAAHAHEADRHRVRQHAALAAAATIVVVIVQARLAAVHGVGVAVLEPGEAPGRDAGAVLA